jgi:hypothetical protein
MGLGSFKSRQLKEGAPTPVASRVSTTAGIRVEIASACRIRPRARLDLGQSAMSDAIVKSSSRWPARSGPRCSRPVSGYPPNQKADTQLSPFRRALALGPLCRLRASAISTSTNSRQRHPYSSSESVQTVSLETQPVAVVVRTHFPASRHHGPMDGPDGAATARSVSITSRSSTD